MVTINVKEALMYVLFIALIILVGYLIAMAKHLIKTVKKTNKILDDAAVVSEVAANKAVQVDGVIDDVQSAVADVAKAVKGQQNFIGAATNFVKAIGSLFAIFNRDGGGKEPADKPNKK